MIVASVLVGKLGMRQTHNIIWDTCRQNWFGRPICPRLGPTCNVRLVENRQSLVIDRIITSKLVNNFVNTLSKQHRFLRTKKGHK